MTPARASAESYRAAERPICRAERMAISLSRRLACARENLVLERKALELPFQNTHPVKHGLPAMENDASGIVAPSLHETPRLIEEARYFLPR